MDLSALPEEILPTIFKFLPLDDRKNVRLTSHVWCDACNCLEIVKHEKFLIRFDPIEDKVAKIANCILSCKKLRPNFEFHGFPVWRLPPSVWDHAKDAVESLHFHNCDMMGLTISNIFLKCLHLRSFHLESYRRERNGLASFFGSEDALDDLIQCKFEQRNLRSLQLYIPICLRSKTYQKLYQIFPNIETFGTGHHYSTGSGETRQRFEFPPMMKSFTNKGDYDGAWMVPLYESKTLRIKELKVAQHFARSLCDQALAYNFFSNNTEIEKVKLSGLMKHSTMDLKLLLFHLLDSLSNLKELKYCISLRGIPLSATEFQHFLRHICRLETLSLSTFHKIVPVVSRPYFKLNNDSDWLKLSPPKIKYTKLTKLKLSFYNQIIYSAILDCCTSSLQYLYLEGVPINSISIWTSKLWDLTELRTLRLHFVTKEYRLNTFVMKRTCLPSLKFFVGHLQKLEHLEICGLDVMHYGNYQTEVDYLAEFDLPLSLKYFYFELNKDPPPERMCELTDIISRNAPNLEILKLHYDGSTSKEVAKPFQYWPPEKTNLFVNYCQRMKKLRCLILNPLCYPERRCDAEVQRAVKQLFEACLSLRFVCGNALDRSVVIVSYDRYTEKLKWYKDYSIMETLEWFPKFGRPQRKP